MRTPREDQSAALERLRQSVAAGKNRIVMQAPTGWGKTMLASELVASARAKGKRVLYTVPALSLIDQTLEMFAHQGIDDVGVIQAHHIQTDWSKPVQVASMQTLIRRELPEADVVLIDECHRWFTFYDTWLCDQKWLKVPMIGLSATPWRRGMANYYHELIVAATTQELIARGVLSPFKVYAPSHPDLSGVSTVAGDYHEQQLSAAMQQGALVADTVKTWQELGEGRPTLCYAVDRPHAMHLKEKFEAAGVPCGYQDAYTDEADKKDREGRRTIKRKFHDGTYKVVCNVGTLTTGIDWDVRCISMCRPTKSDMLFVQIVGRGLRTAPGKDFCLVLDHSDNHQRLGFVSDIDVSHTGLCAKKAPVNDNRTESIRLPKECPNCAFLKPPRTAKCPSCQFVAEAVSGIESEEGELRELKARPKVKPTPAAEMTRERKMTFYAELKGYGQMKGFKPGWADNQYREKVGVWPRGFKDVSGIMATSLETLQWIKSCQIAYAKSKGAGERKAWAKPAKAADERKAWAKPAKAADERVEGTLCTYQDMMDFK